MHRFARWDLDRWSERVRLRGIRHAGHHAQMFTQGFVVRKVKVMELGAVVVADEAGELLKIFRLELDHRRDADAMRLLSSSYQRLSEQAAHRFPAMESKVTGTGGEAENFLRPRRAQPLEING